MTIKHGIPNELGEGGSHLAPSGSGEPSLLTLLRRGFKTVGAVVATMAALKAVIADEREEGQVRLVTADGSRWRFASASTLAGDDLLVVSPTAGTGKWLRVDTFVDLVLPFTFATTDAEVLWTVPAGWRVKLLVPFWKIGTSLTGGVASAIGLSSSNAGLNTKGDMLGGAAGDVAAGLLSTGAFAKGTIGTKALTPGAVLIGGETILFDRITSAFTAGAGDAHVPIGVLLAPAA